MRILWVVLGLLCVALGIAGIPLPLIPTVPFFLLAAFFFAQSSERLHNWLLTHPRFGPPIIDWHERGTIRRRMKWFATISIAVALGVSVVLGLSPLVLLVQALILLGVAVFIWTRPEA